MLVGLIGCSALAGLGGLVSSRPAAEARVAASAAPEVDGRAGDARTSEARPTFAGRRGATGRGRETPTRVVPRRIVPGLLPQLDAAPPDGADERDAEIPMFEATQRAASPPVAQQFLSMRAGAAPTVLTSFPGLTSADGRADPPDPEIAAGNGSVVEMVNSAIRIWSSDGSLRSTVSATSFFNASSGDLSDPRIVYDASSGRWFASVVDVGESTVRLAVSETGDPAGAWTIYDHNAGVCADQPALGVSGSLVVIGYGGFTPPCRSTARPTYLGRGYYVYAKADLVAGRTAYFTYWNPNPAISPVAVVRSTPDPAVAVALTSGSSLETITFSGVPTESALASSAVLPVSIRPLVPPPPGAQPNATNPINTGDIRIHSASEDPATGTIWLGADDACLPQGDSTARACLRIIALHGGSESLDTDIAWTGGDLFYPALAPVGGGSAIVVNGFSSGTTFASVGVFTISPDGSISPSTTIGAGNEAHENPRFGDYFGAAPDGTGGAWVDGETGVKVTGASYDWGTAVGHVAGGSATPPHPPQPPPPPPPVDTTPPRAHALSSSGWLGLTARLRFQVSDNSGKTREQLSVYSRSTVIHRIATSLSPSKPGAIYSVGWHVPTKPVLPLKFCIVAIDAAGNASARSCARISVY